MTTRAEQKARTRDALIDSWLRIIGSGTNFAAVSLREVAKTAGVVPTSFYRHFDDMDELELAAVDELGLDLRRLMRSAVPEGTDAAELVPAVVAAYVRYVEEHADLVQFVNQARTGGTPPLREAIDAELDVVRTRVASAVGDLVPDLTAVQRDTAATVVLAVLLEGTSSLLDLGRRAPARRRELVAALESRLQLVLAGAQADVGHQEPPRRATRRPRKAASS